MVKNFDKICKMQVGVMFTDDLIYTYYWTRYWTFGEDYYLQ